MLIGAFLVFIVQLYRLERYNECKSVYTDLIRNSQDEYEEERKTNLSAVVASMSQWESAPLVRTPHFDAADVFSLLFILFPVWLIRSLFNASVLKIHLRET